MSLFWNSVKYKGLRNQGATCYLNSVLQVLYMTDDFRGAVERYPGTKFIDPQLKNLFGKLKDQTTDTREITEKLDIKRVNEQQDAAEYFEKILNLTSDQASQIFHGELTHRTICSGCGSHTDRDGQFWHLPLTLVDSCGDYSVVSGIEKHFEVSTFSGANQMYCERCDDKRDATIQCVMKHHPEVLTLLLKRFELDYYSMTYFKINHTVHIPHTLQIPENQTYELYAVVDHVGDLRFGHYSASIRSQEEEKWFKFDDTRVKEMNYQPFQVDDFESSSSAYLLFYRKKSAPAANARTPGDIREESAPGGCSPTTGDVDERQEAVTVNGGEKVEEKEEPGIDVRVSVKLPEPRRRVEDQENRDYLKQGNHENNESNDSHLQHQDREKEEVKTARDDEEVFSESVEAEKKEDVSRESLHEERDENQEYEKYKERQQGYIRTPSCDWKSEQEVRNTPMRQECPREVRVVVREKDRDEKREVRGKGRDRDNAGKDEVEESMRVDLEGRREGEDSEIKKKKMEGEKVKSGADVEESRSRRKLVHKIQDDVRIDMPEDDQGRSSRSESREGHRVENSSGDRDLERAETQVKRSNSEHTQDRGGSSHGRAAAVRSRKREKQAESGEGIVEEKQQSEINSHRSRKRKSSISLSKLFGLFSLDSKTKKVKITPETETLEQEAEETHEEKKRRWPKKRNKDKNKRAKPPSCFSFFKKKQSSESD